MSIVSRALVRLARAKGLLSRNYGAEALSGASYRCVDGGDEITFKKSEVQIMDEKHPEKPLSLDLSEINKAESARILLHRKKKKRARRNPQGVSGKVVSDRAAWFSGHCAGAGPAGAHSGGPMAQGLMAPWPQGIMASRLHDGLRPWGPGSLAY